MYEQVKRRVGLSNVFDPPKKQHGVSQPEARHQRLKGGAITRPDDNQLRPWLGLEDLGEGKNQTIQVLDPEVAANGTEHELAADTEARAERRAGSPIRVEGRSVKAHRRDHRD